MSCCDFLPFSLEKQKKRNHQLGVREWGSGCTANVPLDVTHKTALSFFDCVYGGDCVLPIPRRWLPFGVAIVKRRHSRIVHRLREDRGPWLLDFGGGRRSRTGARASSLARRALR